VAPKRIDSSFWLTDSVGSSKIRSRQTEFCMDGSRENATQICSPKRIDILDSNKYIGD